jgi:hypothetical protein
MAWAYVRRAIRPSAARSSPTPAKRKSWGGAGRSFRPHPAALIRRRRCPPPVSGAPDAVRIDRIGWPSELAARGRSNGGGPCLGVGARVSEWWVRSPRRGSPSSTAVQPSTSVTAVSRRTPSSLAGSIAAGSDIIARAASASSTSTIRPTRFDPAGSTNSRNVQPNCLPISPRRGRRATLRRRQLRGRPESLPP